MSSQFSKLQSLVLEPGIPVEKYRSNRSGLTVCVADVPGPLVNGFFCLATEAHDDDGLPHTLEHLIFLGSEKYPYKGVLDLLANRCFARGTNAWTDVDYTCYTLTTAGSEGFLQILPIYLDHILNPTLTDEGYTTEVHHITGKGEDAGVVYCEMQARENTQESLTSLSMLRSMYPGKCGYKSETGGILKNLRESTSNTKVRQYHQDFYRSENLCVIVTGHVNVEALFAALQPIEDSIASKGVRVPFQRPWQSVVPPLESKAELRVAFPSDDTDSGSVSISWRGPNVCDQRTFVALQILWEYLTDSPVAPLQRELVEIDEPFCSSVGMAEMENKETCMTLTAENVPTNLLGEVHHEIMRVLEGLVSGSEQIKQSRMSSLIKRATLDVLDKLEDCPHNTIADHFIGDFLYSQSQADFTLRMERVELLKSLHNENELFWQNLLKNYVVNTPYVLVIGEPSTDFGSKLAEEEKQRVAKQCQDIGEEGLTGLSAELESAIAKNEVEAPSSVLSSLPIPSIKSINFHRVSVVTNNPKRPSSSSSSASLDLSTMPMIVEVDDVCSSFVDIKVLLDTSRLPEDLRLYLPLYLEVMYESPMMRNGKQIGHEQVIEEMERDLLDHGAALGFYNDSSFRCGAFGELACISVKTDIGKYPLAVNWLRELLFSVKFTPSRVSSVAKKLSKEITERLRSGSKVVNVAMRHLLFQGHSNQVNCSMLTQRAFLKKLLSRVRDDSQSVCDSLDRLRSSLATLDNTVVQIVCSVEKLKDACSDPAEPWLGFIRDAGGSVSSGLVGPQPLPWSASYLHPLDARSGGGDARSNAIFGLKSEDSSYLVQVCPGIGKFDDPDRVALQVFIEYLIAMEGPMWRSLRGAGLSYDYNVFNATESGLLYFCLSKCTNLVEAYKEGKKLLLSYAHGSAEFEQVKVEAAISSVVFAFIQHEEAVSDAADEVFISYYRNVPINHQRKLLEEVIRVTESDLRRVAAKFFCSLFEPSTSCCAVCCNSSKVEEISSGLKS